MEINGYVALFLLWLFVTVTGLLLRPAPEGHGTHQQLGFPPCPSVLLFNRPCPGCGLTTSFTRLLHADVAGAFEAHWLGPVLYALFTFLAWRFIWAYFRAERFYIHTPKFQRFMFAFLVLFLVYGGGRFAVTRDYRTETESALADWIKFRQPHSP